MSTEEQAPKPSPPPPIADGDRLHGPSPNHCSLCGKSYVDVPRHYLHGTHAEELGGHSFCLPCSDKRDGFARTEIERRLAKDSPGSAEVPKQEPAKSDEARDKWFADQDARHAAKIAALKAEMDDGERNLSSLARISRTL